MYTFRSSDRRRYVSLRSFYIYTIHIYIHIYVYEMCTRLWSDVHLGETVCWWWIMKKNGNEKKGWWRKKPKKKPKEWKGCCAIRYVSQCEREACENSPTPEMTLMHERTLSSKRKGLNRHHLQKLFSKIWEICAEISFLMWDFQDFQKKKKKMPNSVEKKKHWLPKMQWSDIFVIDCPLEKKWPTITNESDTKDWRQKHTVNCNST